MNSVISFQKVVEIKMTGLKNDHDLADKAAGFTGVNKRPAGYTWHHHHVLLNTLEEQL